MCMHVCIIISYNCKLFACRPILSHYGLWDQLRVNKGREWYLMLAVQEQLGGLRVNSNRPPYLQTTSTMVHLYTCTYVISQC